MSEDAPALVPLFRSVQQLRILGVLFSPDTEPLSVGDLASRAGVSQSTTSHEVARLVDHGIAVDQRIGRTRLVSANRRLPWATDLQSMLAKTVGVPAQLASALADIHGVEEAFVFGSWAARYHGEPGPPPSDIDVAVIGSASLKVVRAACRPLEATLGREVNPVVFSRHDWAAVDDGFTTTIREGPLVSIPLPANVG